MCVINLPLSGEHAYGGGPPKKSKKNKKEGYQMVDAEELTEHWIVNDSIMVLYTIMPYLHLRQPHTNSFLATVVRISKRY